VIIFMHDATMEELKAAAAATHTLDERATEMGFN
jgi:hypothetical protein